MTKLELKQQILNQCNFDSMIDDMSKNRYVVYSIDRDTAHVSFDWNGGDSYSHQYYSDGKKMAKLITVGYNSLWHYYLLRESIEDKEEIKAILKEEILIQIKECIYNNYFTFTVE